MQPRLREERLPSLEEQRQLEQELREPGTWFNVGGEPGILFDVPAEDRWQAAYGAAGVDPRQLVTGGGRA
mgnify:CR=1 FL=1